MKRLLTLTSNDFYTGISAGAHVDRGGLWSEADGINVFVDTSGGSTQAGLLQTCADPTDITAGVAGIPTDFAIDGTDMYVVTDAGDIALIDLTTDSNASVEVDSTGHTFTGTTFANMGTGTELFQVGSENKFLYYFCTIDGTYHIGRYDVDTNTDDADWQSLGSTGTRSRPIVKFKDRLYYGNGSTIGSVFDNGAGASTNDGNVLDLPKDMLVTALDDDGTYLVVAATTNTALNSTVYGNTRIFFWDTNQASWTREFEIPDTFITAVRRVGDRIYAIGGRGLWVLSFQSRPYKIRSLDTADVPGSQYHGSISSINNAVLWGGGNSTVYSYGEMMQGIGVQNVMHCPFEYDTDIAVTSMVAAQVRNGRMFTGTRNSKLYRWNVSEGGATGLDAKTVYIPLEEQSHIREVEVVLGEPLASGDSLNIDLQSDEDVAATDWGTISFTAHGAVQRVKLKGSKRNVDNLRLIMNFTGGNVKIKRINVHGTREVIAPR